MKRFLGLAVITRRASLWLAFLAFVAGAMFWQYVGHRTDAQQPLAEEPAGEAAAPAPTPSGEPVGASNQEAAAPSAPTPPPVSPHAPSPKVTGLGAGEFGASRLELEDVTEEMFRFRMDFSEPIATETLDEFLAAADSAGNPVVKTIEGVSPTSSVVILVPKTTAVPIAFTLKPGLPNASNPGQTGRAQSFVYPSPTPLEVTADKWTSASGNENRIHLTFSAPVRRALLEQWVKLRAEEGGDEIPFSIEQEGELLDVYLLAEGDLSFLSSLRVSIAAGLPGADLRILAAPFSATLQRAPEPLRLSDHWWDERGVDGAALNLDLNVRVKTDEFQRYLEVEPAVANLAVESTYGNNLRILGDWHSETVHRIRVREGLKEAGGSVCVATGVTLTLEKTPEIRGVGFGQEGKFYIPRRGLGQITATARNMTRAKLNLWQVFPNNLVPALERMNNGITGGEFNDRLAKLAGSKDITFPAATDTKNTAAITMAELLPPDRRGVFTLQFEEGRDWENTKIILWTDIGALAHWIHGELVVFAHDLFSLTPLEQAAVTIYSQKNQVMGSAITDAQGIALITNLDTALGRPRLVVIESAQDYTFLALEAREDDPVAFDTAMPGYSRTGYDAFLYADRNLYRPGETVHARWIVRTNYGDALPNVPLELRLINPKNQKVWTQPVTLSELGTGGLELATEKAYLTGRYTLELRVPGAKTALGAMPFNLEEFVPNRIKASVSLEQDRWVANTPYAITVNAQHLYGAPASQRKCETKVILRRSSYTSDTWREFRFGNDSEYTPEVLSLGEAQTDDAGNAGFSYTYAPNPKVTFPVDVIVRAEVSELGGRSVTGIQEARLYPSDICLGVGATSGEAGKVDVFAAAMRPDESPSDLGAVKVTLEKQVWSYFVRQYSGYNEPNWSKSFEEVETREVPLSNGRGTASFAVSDSYGYYRVRVHSAATPQFSTLSFYKYWDRVEVADAARPSLIKLTLDKKEYGIGEEAVARIESPFDGKGVAVLQGEHIHKVIPISVVDGVAEARFGLLREYYPNVWVEATVVHEVKQERIGVYPFSSFAMANVPLRDPARRIAIAYPGLPREIRPDQEMEIALETKDAAGQPVAAEVTLAAVDEGIHAILDYQDPDPAGWFERARKPDYRRAHYYDKVAYDFEGQPIGGDMIARRLGKGNATIDENWIKPVALWSGTAQTDASGRTVIKFTVPEFNGQLRLVALAVSAAATGAHRENMFVRRPYILRTNMPRFVLPGDRFQCGAVIMNTTETSCTGRLRWKISGALQTGEGSMELTLPAQGEASARADFAAGPVAGAGEIHWDMDIVGGDGQVIEHMSESAALPVRPPSVYQQEHQFSVVEPGESLTFKNAKFIEDDSLENALVAGAHPFIRLRDSLEWLIEYPYGCAEQTTSRCLPMYALRQGVAMAGDSAWDTARIAEAVQAGIGRLFSMQTPSGGLSAWPWGTSDYPYGSVYAGHFLTLVHRERAFSLPEEEFKRLQEYIRRLAKEWSDDSLSGRHLRAYALYVLALDGDLEALQQIPRFDTIPLPRAARYLLAAALALNTQDPARVQTYLDTAPVEEFTQRERTGTLNSDIRNAALELMALTQMNAPQTQLREKVTPLVHYLQNRGQYTTQEVAFAATAVGIYLSNVGANLDSASASIVSPEGETPITGAHSFSGKHIGPGAFVVTNTGQQPIFADFTTAGMPAQPELAALEKGMSLTRLFRKEAGSPQPEPLFAQGETYLVELRFSSIAPLKNVVVADLLPAGLEIENPRLDADALAGWNLAGALTPAYLEIRDDRLVTAFDEIPEGEQHFYYLVRAVTPGVFQYPSVRAECMYDPEVRASSAPAVATVE